GVEQTMAKLVSSSESLDFLTKSFRNGDSLVLLVDLARNFKEVAVDFVFTKCINFVVPITQQSEYYVWPQYLHRQIGRVFFPDLVAILPQCILYIRNELFDVSVGRTRVLPPARAKFF